MLPVNPPSPAFRGVRGLRLIYCRAAGPRALIVGLRSRRNVTSLKRGAAFAASTGVRRARGSCAATRLLCVCERVRLRDLWLLADKTRAYYLSFSAFFVLLPPCRARPEIRIYDNFILLSNTGLDPVQNLVLPRSAEPKHSTPEQKRTDQRQCRAPPVKHTQGLHSALRVTTKQQP